MLQLLLHLKMITLHSMYFEVKTCNQFEDLVHLEVTFSGVTLFMVTAVYFVPVSSNVTFVMTES